MHILKIMPIYKIIIIKIIKNSYKISTAQVKQCTCRLALVTCLIFWGTLKRIEGNFERKALRL